MGGGRKNNLLYHYPRPGICVAGFCHQHQHRDGKPRPLFTFPGLQHTGFYTAAWDATPDGRRFLLNVTGENSEQSRAILVTNWPSRLRQ